MKTVFLSYARIDSFWIPEAEKIINLICPNATIIVDVDFAVPGATGWPSVLERLIHADEHVIMWSVNASHSPYVVAEMLEGRARRPTREIVVLTLDGTQPPGVVGRVVSMRSEMVWYKKFLSFLIYNLLFRLFMILFIMKVSYYFDKNLSLAIGLCGIATFISIRAAWWKPGYES
jgi:hypothetical protein